MMRIDYGVTLLFIRLYMAGFNWFIGEWELKVVLGYYWKIIKPIGSISLYNFEFLDETELSIMDTRVFD